MRHIAILCSEQGAEDPSGPNQGDGGAGSHPAMAQLHDGAPALAAGRRQGTIRGEDGVLELKLASPRHSISTGSRHVALTLFGEGLIQPVFSVR